MGAYHAGKEAEAQDPLAVCMHQAFVVYQGDVFFYDMLQHSLVMGLLLFGMREEEVGFTGHELFLWHFLDAKEDVAMGEVFLQGDACVGIFLVCIAAVRGGLHADTDPGIMLQDPLALQGSKGYAVVVRDLFFTNKAYVNCFGVLHWPIYVIRLNAECLSHM